MIKMMTGFGQDGEDENNVLFLVQRGVDKLITCPQYQNNVFDSAGSIPNI